MLETMRKHGVTLTLSTTNSIGLTAAANELTRNTINQQVTLQQKALFDQILPANCYNNGLLKSCYLVSAPTLGKGQHKVWIVRNNDQLVGVVTEATVPDDYPGTIQLLVAADSSGTVLGTRVAEYHGAPGPGDKTELRLLDWTTHFVGRVIHGQNGGYWVVEKDGGDFGQFTDATITPRAAANAAKCAGLYAQTLPA